VSVGEYRATVLLALADEDGPEALAQRLREAGLDVVSGGTGGELAFLDGHAIDVLVASAPIRAAPIELVVEALRRDPGLEVVVATAQDSFEHALSCLRAGASDIVGLPIDGEALLFAVTRALERRRSRSLARELLAVAPATGLGQLTGSIAHEIANPVAILTSCLDAAAQSLAVLAELRSLAPQEAGPLKAWWERTGREAFEQANEVTAEAQEGAQRLKVLARDLRGMARCDASAVGELEVGEAIEAALRVARAELTSHVKVEVEVPRRTLVRASRGALTQALVHLFVRAAQAARAAGVRRGHVDVRVHEREDTILVEVEDDIAPAKEEAAARYLAPYLPAGTPAGAGALGLAVARDLVERQGGSLTARPRQGGGTVFELRLHAAKTTRRAASR